MFPFKIEDGSVATTVRDEHALKSKILFCLGTEVNERVMRPQWGINIMQTVYMVGGDLDVAVPEAIQDAFRKFFPKVRLVEATVVRHPNDPTYVTVEVRFGQINTDVDEIIRLDMPVSEGIE
jgi:phage baseplate assembly protein W